MSELQKREQGSIDMTQGSPTKLIVAFSLPLLAGNVLQQMYNMVDSMVVGKFVGKTALAAVSTGFPIIFLLTSLFIGLAMGATIMIAQYIGAQDQKSVAETVNTIYSAMMIIFIPLSLIGLLATGPLLALIRVPAAVMPEAKIYCYVVFGGLIGGLGYNVNTGIMQGLGDSKTPLIFLSIACVINIILDLLFVLVLPWGVFGVALATIIAQSCSWVFGIFYINKKYSFLHIKLCSIRIDKKLLGQVVRLGVPSGIQQCQFSVAIMFMQALVNGFGTDFSAGFGAANKIDSFAFMPIQSFSTAVTTYVGQNIGAGRLDRVKKGVNSTLILSIVTCIIITAIVLPLSRPMLSLFNDDPAVLDVGQAYLYRVLGPMFILAVQFTLSSTLRGAGAAVVPMVSAIVALWAARVPFAYLLAYTLGPNEMFWSYAIGWTIGLIITAIVYLRGRWKDKCVVNQPLL
ncbi:MAG: MATE family efflux transporter [Pseudoflavonifractor sp.]